MSNYIEYKDKIAFHPGYYIREIVDDSGLTQEDFAKRLDTTPKNLSKLINGEQSLSVDMALKLSRMLKTSVEYWLNLQSAYDNLIAEFKSDQELEKERQIFHFIDYSYFRSNFHLPDFPRKIDSQIKATREFLNVSTLCVFNKKDMAVNFRSSGEELSEAATVRANVMVQIAVNEALKSKDTEYEFNASKFASAVDYALTLTQNHEEFYLLIKDAFYKAGVFLIILPNMKGSHINGATKKIGRNIMLMVNDRRLYADTFWFTLFHEIGHIINGDYGISFENETGQKEEKADQYAEDKLIPSDEFASFIAEKRFEKDNILSFAKKINRDPGIIAGRLEKEGMVDCRNPSIKSLHRKYKVNAVS